MTARFVDNYLGYLLGQANHALFKDFEQVVKAAGLSSLEWRVLATLQDSPPLPVSQLAREVLSQQPTLTKQVQRMSAKGWVTLTACADDQRRTLVRITATGRAVVLPLLAQARTHEHQQWLARGAEDLQLLKQLLQKMAAPNA